MKRGRETTPRDMMIRAPGSRGWVVPAVLLTLVFVLTVGSSVVMAGADTTLTITTDASTDTDPTYTWVYTIDLGEAVTITWTLDTQTASGVTFAGELTRCVTFPVGTSCNILGGGVETSGGEPFEVEYFFAPSAAGYYSMDGSYEGCTICGPEAPELNGCDAATKYLRVDQAGTTASIASDLNPSEEGDDVIFTATITSDWIGGPGIGGTADFYIDNDPFPDTLICENRAVTDGQATCTYDFSTEGDGSYDIYVVYDEDDDDPSYADSTSSSILQEVLPVPVGTTTTLTSDSPNPSPPPDTELVVGEEVTFIATVTAASGSDDPTGTVDFYGDATYLGSASLETDLFPDGAAEAELIDISFDSVGSVDVTAIYTGVPGEFEGSSSDPHNVVVSAADTVATVTDDFPDPSVLGQPYQVEGTVGVASPGDGHPTGTVTVEDEAGNSCTAIVDPVDGTWSCTITSDPATLEDVYELRANFDSDDTDFNDSPVIPWGTPGLATHTYTDPTTRTEVMGADTPLIVDNTATFEVHVVDVSDPSTIPPGTVTITVDPTGQGDLSISGPPYDLTLDAAGRCTFTYTPTSAATTPHVFTVSYNGEDDPGNGWFHEPSEGTYAQQIVRRAADMTLILGPTTAYIGQPVTVTVHVEDDTTEGTPSAPQGTVTLDDGGKNGVFSDDTPTLDGNGECTVTYTPYPFDTDPDLAPPWDGDPAAITTVTATYDGSDVHTGKSAMANLTVELRPVEVYVACSQEMLFVNETYTDCTVTVKDVAEEGTATSPLGVISSLTTVLSPDSDTYNLAGPTFPSADESEWTFDYLCTGLDPDAEGGYDTITAEFTASDGIHASTSGAFIQPLAKRYTITTLTGYDTAAGVTCTATVEEDPDNDGIPVPIEGKFVLVGNPDEDISGCGALSGSSPSCTFDVESSALLANVTVKYVPSDGVHLASTASANISRADQPEFDPDQGGDGTTGADCDDGCGSGGVNIDQMIFDLNASDVALAAVQMALEVVSIGIDLIPDGVVTAGIVVQSGVTIPYSDIAAAIVSGAAIALEIARTAMTTDLDGDGLPDTVEQTVTGTDYTKTDTDGDGLGDYDEISECGGYYGGSLRPNPNDPDSDDDGLSDGDEAGLYNTSFCVADTDCDTVSDGDEVGTWECGDARNHANPLELDTDGDGLDDNLEFSEGPGCNSCPYVNDDDSDDDGLQDGYEDADQSGSIVNTIGGSASQGSGETDYCDADTDDDKLLDGEEEGLFGTSVTPEGVSVTVGTSGPALGVTVPALDTDMDNDGLTDYDEVNVYQTDPMDADTDDDTVSDYDEVATWAYADSRDHSNPREDDTDGDGLTDDVEIAEGCPYVNDDDSDDDALQDGTESWDGNGSITTGTIGDSTNQADTSPSGETHFCDPDTDGDGLTDGEEVALLGGLPVDGTNGFAPVTPEGVSTTIGAEGPALDPTVPPLDDDSDNDGLSDYEEVNITGTDPLDQDTDNDTISDANELVCTGGSWPSRSFDQESDPLDLDTDDDGLTDAVEYSGSGLGTSRDTGGTRDLTCPYVNDDDSDDDGLQDGVEDANHDGAWGESGPGGIAVGDSASQATKTVTYWETKACVADSDGDGLLDGEEASLIGGGPVIGRPVTWPDVQPSPGFTTVTPEGVSTTVGTTGPALAPTVPALDDDSDNDGLSDYEEVNITGTDPLDADTDNDTISDANELICTGGTWPSRTFDQESDPLDIDTDDDELTDNIEYPGTGLGITRTTGGTRDLICPYVNDADSDDDGLQDGTEDANHDGTWGVAGVHAPVGTFSTQAATNSDGYYETDLCNPDTDGDGLLDGEEVGLIGGEPTSPSRPYLRDLPGFVEVIPQAVSTVLPNGTTNLATVPESYTHDPSPSPGTQGDLIAPYEFAPVEGDPYTATIPALDVDSDNDGLSDYEEVNITGTDPLDQDSDNDTLMDSDELVATSDAWNDPDHPRRTFDQVSDPLDINTDDDHLFDPQEYYYGGQYGSGLSLLAGDVGGVRDEHCPYVNDDDSDNDGIQDGAVVTITPAGVITSTGAQYAYTHYEDFIDLDPADVAHPGTVRTVATSGYGEQQDDTLWDVCDPDSDGDGLNDGEEIAIGTNPNDWDTDDDGRNDWHEQTGGGPIPTDPFDPDTDDDGLLDSAEVFGLNPTNPVNADTDGDGLCDGGAGTPWMTSGDARILVNPICKSCAVPTLDPCSDVSPGTPLTRAGSVDGIGDHPNPYGYGEDKNGNGQWDGAIGDEWVSGDAGTPETDPNQFDTDGDGDGDGVEVLGFSTSRQYMIPPADIFGREITVEYPACGCLEALIADTDQDGLEDGYEDRNHDGNFDFLPSEFDHQDPLPGPPIPYPTETNPCDPDTDHDELTDWEERFQRQPLLPHPDVPYDDDGDGFVDEDRIDGIDNDDDGLIDEDPSWDELELTFNPTNPLDHDTDNDWILDGPEVYWECVAVEYWTLDNDSDGLIDEDPIDGIDNDEDGLLDEDPVDFWVRFVPMLDPTNRDSDSDGWLDGLDDDPCNSELIPLLAPVQAEPIDTDGDGFSDDDELLACTHPNDPEDHPIAYGMMNLDLDECFDDRLWLEPAICCGIANSVVIDIDSNVLIDIRVQIVQPRDVKVGDFDGDGHEDDARYVVEYAFAMYRVVQHRIVATIDDFDMDLVIDAVSLELK